MNVVVVLVVVLLIWKLFGEYVAQEFREIKVQMKGGRHACYPPRWRSLGEQWRCTKCDQVWERDSGFWFYNDKGREDKVVRFSWNARLCDACWYEGHPRQDPVRVIGSPWGQCCNCGDGTASGIFVRMNPEDQNYPQEEAA